MKSCDEMVESLFERRKLYIAEKKRKRKLLISSISTMCCMCLVAVLSFELGVWEKNRHEQMGTLEENNGHDLTLITSFNGGNSIYLTPEYLTPENGNLYFSLPLDSAMEKYKNDARYRVVIDIFSNRNLLLSESDQVKEEVERLSNYGYDITIDTCFNGTSYQKYVVMNAKLNQLKEFDKNEKYGYFMFLYDERVEMG